ncbi:MAG: hypothetical protein ABEI74_00040 [Candidatus Pacearchaeota archaeon]
MEISIETKEREKLVDITEKVKENIPSEKGIVHIFLCEFDGPRRERRIILSFVKCE